MDIQTNITLAPSNRSNYLTEKYCLLVKNQSKQRDYSDPKTTLTTVVIPITCAFGIVGNILNLLVLSRRRHRMDRMEKAANIGLIALAVSDMLFCVSVLPRAWVQEHFMHKMGFELLYRTYSNAIINTFILCSTWLTVTMATSRYLAICHPLRAREIVGMTFANSSMVVVFVLCVLCNLPRYLFYSFEAEVYCPEGFYIYICHPGLMKKNKNLYLPYTVTYTVLCLVIPLSMLTFCNLRLIQTLRESARLRQQYTNKRQAAESTSHVITLTLIGIIVMYTILVAPNEALILVRELIDKPYKNTVDFAIHIMNVAQAVNFSAHFVLYCAINVHFRRTIFAWFCQCSLVRPGHGIKDRDSSRTTQSYYMASWSTTSQKGRAGASLRDGGGRGSTPRRSTCEALRPLKEEQDVVEIQ